MFHLHMLDEFLNKYLLAFLKIITVRAMKLNVQTPPSCMAQKCKAEDKASHICCAHMSLGATQSEMEHSMGSCFKLL